MKPDFDEQEHSRPPAVRKDWCRRWPKEETKNKKLLISLDMIENFCIECVTWDEVKPVIDMLTSIYTKDRPPEVDNTIKRIKKEFRNRIYGTNIKANNVVMKNPYVKGPLNSFRNNQKVEVGK